LGIVKKIWAPIRKLFSPPVLPQAGYGPGGVMLHFRIKCYPS